MGLELGALHREVPSARSLIALNPAQAPDNWPRDNTRVSNLGRDDVGADKCTVLLQHTVSMGFVAG
jgi:hypothetical protein